MYKIRKVREFNLWKVIEPTGMVAYKKTWQECLDFVNTALFYNFYSDREIMSKRLNGE